jgi:hypothetical protein
MGQKARSFAPAALTWFLHRGWSAASALVVYVLLRRDGLDARALTRPLVTINQSPRSVVQGGPEPTNSDKPEVGSSTPSSSPLPIHCSWVGKSQAVEAVN